MAESIIIDNNYVIQGNVNFSDTVTQFHEGQLKSGFVLIPEFTAIFGIAAKTYRLEGDLRYEYNPFRNLRLANDIKDSNNKVIQRKGELIDFTTKNINFDLNHPITIEAQESYDGSVNLILNDDLNPPLIINSRFTAKEDDRYVVIDRNGNNDTNLYDENNLLSQLRLYKTSDKISQVELVGLENGGSNQCGNYTFYFKYADADGNETDVIMESGIVSCYVGNINDPFSTRGGNLDERTDKIIKFKINNIDSSYEYLNIYYTRITSDLNKTQVNKAYQITNRFSIDKKSIKNNSLEISISGYEDSVEIPVEDINTEYNIVNSAKTMTQCQNRLFLANTTEEAAPIKELSDLSLRIYPFASQDNNIGCVNSSYKDTSGISNNYEYYNALNVYNYLGYWNKEIYRFGIVFILNNNSLSDVFNVRGINDMPLLGSTNILNEIKATYTYHPLNKDGKRLYIEETDKHIISGGKVDKIENARGVSRLLSNTPQIQNDKTMPIGINFLIEKEILQEINKYAKGFFFVRQKRIPTILSQGFTIGLDDYSNLPSLPVVTEDSTTPSYIYERFYNQFRILGNEFYDRLHKPTMLSNTIKDGKAMICPDASLNYELFNNLFTGTEFVISKSTHDIEKINSQKCLRNTLDNLRHFFPKSYQASSSSYTNVYTNKIKLTNVEDGVSMRSSGTAKFAARAGIPEEGWRFLFIGKEDRDPKALNIVRGVYPSFVGIENYGKSGDFIDIHTQGYSLSNLNDYFYLRSSSYYPFYSISNRYDISSLLNTTDSILSFKEYRGDCFIGNYSVRMVRNFQDPELKINDTIVDPTTWSSTYKGISPQGNVDQTKLAKLNRSDVNAVKLGHWVTLKFCSNINLCYRTINNSNIGEYAITGKARSFFPLSPMSITGESKIADSLTLNSGYNTSTSQKEYVPIHDVPYIKTIFDNRIYYSDVNISDAFKNGYRVFKGLDYQDYNSNYGTITKIIEWFDKIIVILERGVCILPINERVIGGNGDGGEVAVYNYGILGKKLMPLSNNYGSTWKDSIVQTNNYIYGVDAIAKKIWRTDGRTFELISDFKIQKFLNDNIVLSEREITPSLALRNISTHYNSYKQDVMFTFYDITRTNEDVTWNMCWNEKLSKWVTRYSWTPLSSAAISNIYFSYDRESAKNTAILAYSLKTNKSSEGVVLDSIDFNSKTETKTMSLKFIDTNDETLVHYNNYYTVIYSLVNIVEPNKDLTMYDNNLFNIVDNKLHFTGNNLDKYIYTLKIFVTLKNKNGTEYNSFADTISVRPSVTAFTGNRTDYNSFYTSRFWKHGQAGIFDYAGEVKPSTWYGKEHPFEFEFVVSDSGQAHKIYDNLRIISNAAEPDSIEIKFIGDVFDEFKDAYNQKDGVIFKSHNANDSLVTTYNKSTGFNTYQKLKNIKTFGRVKSNMEYKEDYWNIEIKPINLPNKSSKDLVPVKNIISVSSDDSKQGRIRDKYAKIRIRYKGSNRAIINQIQTIYTQSYA